MTSSGVHVQPQIRSGGDVAIGAATLGMVVLAFLAFDDITTDNATSFPLEYGCPALAALWSVALVVWLLRTRRFWLGGASLLILAAAAWGQRAIGPGTEPSLRPEYIATVSALAWFLVMAVALAISGFRLGRTL